MVCEKEGKGKGEGESVCMKVSSGGGVVQFLSELKAMSGSWELECWDDVLSGAMGRVKREFKERKRVDYGTKKQRK